MARHWDLTEVLRQPTPVKVTREGLEAMRHLLLARPMKHQPPILSEAAAEEYARLLKE